MTIQSTVEPCDLDVKRLYFPVVVKADCPECGKTVTMDFSDDYLSYPTANVPMDVTFLHTEEEPYVHHEWSIPLVLRLSLEMAEADE